MKRLTRSDLRDIFFSTWTCVVCRKKKDNKLPGKDFSHRSAEQIRKQLALVDDQTKTYVLEGLLTRVEELASEITDGIEFFDERDGRARGLLADALAPA